jgi:hypothetical protein
MILIRIKNHEQAVLENSHLYKLFQTVKKVKGHEAGVYSALQLEEADCTLTP